MYSHTLGHKPRTLGIIIVVILVLGYNYNLFFELM